MLNLVKGLFRTEIGRDVEKVEDFVYGHSHTEQEGSHGKAHRMGKVYSATHVCKGMGNAGGEKFRLNRPKIRRPEFFLLDLELILYLGSVGGTES